MQDHILTAHLRDTTRRPLIKRNLNKWSFT